MAKTERPLPKPEDFRITGLKGREKLFRSYGNFNAQDDLVMEGYRFVGIKRAEDDGTARKVRAYQEQGRDLEKLSVSVMTGERSEQILEGVEAYFVR